MITILEMYISLLPVIIAGVLNMVWCKLPVLPKLKWPIDNYINYKDGDRLFGDNKTWKGFIGMIGFSIVSTLLWGLLCKEVQFLNVHNYLYVNHENTVSYNLLIGFWLGVSYVLLELPNSFIKRRNKVKPGKTTVGWKGILFIILDQSDSILGCVFVIAGLYPMTLWFYFAYVALGAFTHIIINVLLYGVKLRKNMF